MYDFWAFEIWHYKLCDHFMSSFLHLACFQDSSTLQHVLVCHSFSWHNIPLYRQTRFIHLSLGLFGCFYLLAIRDNAVTNMFFWVCSVTEQVLSMHGALGTILSTNKKILWGWDQSSMVEHLSSTQETLGFIPSTTPCMESFCIFCFYSNF